MQLDILALMALKISTSIQHDLSYFRLSKEEYDPHYPESVPFPDCF